MHSREICIMSGLVHCYCVIVITVLNYNYLPLYEFYDENPQKRDAFFSTCCVV